MEDKWGLFQRFLITENSDIQEKLFTTISMQAHLRPETLIYPGKSVTKGGN